MKEAPKLPSGEDGPYPDKIGVVYFNDGTREFGPANIPPSENYLRESVADLRLSTETARLRELLQECERALQDVAKHKGMMMMGPQDEDCGEIMVRADSMEDAVRRGFALGSHRAYEDCVSEVSDVLAKLRAEKGK